MSAKPTHRLVVKQGEYVDNVSGQTKGRWLRIGMVFKHDDGKTSIKLDCIPAGLPNWEGWVSVFPIEDKQAQGQQGGYGQQPAQQPAQQGYGQQQPAPAQTDFDEDIPF